MASNLKGIWQQHGSFMKQTVGLLSVTPSLFGISVFGISEHNRIPNGRSTPIYTAVVNQPQSGLSD